MRTFAFALVILLTMSTTARAQSQAWREAYDFDGDGQRDLILVEYSGGAHCCYRVGVRFSERMAIMLPFEIDGGYVGGLSLDRPERFSIRTSAGALPEITMEVSTYNGEASPIAAKWRHVLGVEINRIAVCFPGRGL